jgi:hypothetical protein
MDTGQTIEPSIIWHIGLLNATLSNHMSIINKLMETNFLLLDSGIHVFCLDYKLNRTNYRALWYSIW